MDGYTSSRAAPKLKAPSPTVSLGRLDLAANGIQNGLVGVPAGRHRKGNFMHDVQLGCQTITWGENQRDHFPGVFADISAAGFSGVEIGFRHIQHQSPMMLKQMLDAAGLTLIATHIGGNLEDADQAGGERDMLHQVLDYLEKMNVKLLMYSGLKYDNAGQFQRDLRMLCRAAKRCGDRGIQLLYHNHDWEFSDHGRVIDTLIERTDIGFCPDIGWVMKAGADVPTLLHRIESRLGAIHFKDFAAAGGITTTGVDTVLLGDGVAPLAQTAQWVIRHAPQVWMIAEQDKTDLPAAEVARRNAGYLRRIFRGGDQPACPPS